MKTRRKQTAVKGRFSAMMISAVVHAAVLIAAGTFVAVTVVQRQGTRFEGRQVVSRRMQLQRLQVPQRARMERQSPQMSQRITAQAISTRSIDFQMPEIAGLGGGITVDMSGAGFAGSLGFSTPQINIFGLRSQGEKVVFLLDTNRAMLVDEIGGIPAYQIIKDELISMIGRLPPTALFNVIVFEGFRKDAMGLSNELLLPTKENLVRLQEWLAPLNAQKGGVGLETIGFQGASFKFEPRVPIPNIQAGWMQGLSYALRAGADSVYWLGANDDMQWVHEGAYQQAKRGRPVDPSTWSQPEEYGLDFSTYPGGEPRWRGLVAQARRMHEAENARRRATGQPARVLGRYGGEQILVRTYLPGAQIPRSEHHDIAYWFTSQDVIQYIEAMLRAHQAFDRHATSTGLRRQRSFSFNVIHFVPVNEPPGHLPRLGDVPRRLNGEYVQLRGLDAIRSETTSRSILN